MNYYPHHLGDYAKDTAHLSLVEDGAYLRMIHLYYSTEAPLPADRAKLYRLLRVSEKADKATVDGILSEFFTLKGDGWHKDRCDQEIAKAQEKRLKAAESAARRWGKPQSEGNANAYANAFQELVPTHMPTLMRSDMPSQCQSQCEGNAPNPNPNPKEETTRLGNYQPGPVDNSAAPVQGESQPATPEPPPDPPPDGVTPTAAGQWAGELRRKGVTITSQHPTLRAWIADNFTLPWALEALEIARQSKPTGPIAANYLDRIIRDPPKKKSNGGAWWTSEAKIVAKGAELQLQARPGETMDGFKARITEALGKARQSA